MRRMDDDGCITMDDGDGIPQIQVGSLGKYTKVPMGPFQLKRKN
jgi:hypothetical protein